MSSPVYYLLLILLLAQVACTQNKQINGINVIAKPDLYLELEQLKDSVQIGDITVYNSFKHQLLANRGNTYDSMLIVNKVYKKHQKLWDGCYAMIFGEENAGKFNTQEGMVAWNRNIYVENRELMEQRVRELLQQNVDSILTASLAGFTTLISKHKPKAEISIAFVPLEGFTFGGCDQSMFALDLMHSEFDLNRVLKEGFPHEINHLAYESTRNSDPDRATALRNTIDEGLACYYTYKYFDGKVTKHRAVENMTEEEWDWYMQHEKEIFTKSKPYLLESSEKQTPYSCNCGMHRGEKLFEDAPQTICYWLGFRIIEFYEKKNGAGSWKDIYELPVRDVLAKSGYEDYINSL